jgi:hypothetical protein
MGRNLSMLIKLSWSRESLESRAEKLREVLQGIL